VHEREEGTAATVAIAIYNGAHIVRVHDVKGMKRVAAVASAIRKAQ
jgi:dihydropteroate synthase